MFTYHQKCSASLTWNWFNFKCSWSPCLPFGDYTFKITMTSPRGQWVRLESAWQITWDWKTFSWKKTLKSLAEFGIFFFHTKLGFQPISAFWGPNKIITILQVTFLKHFLKWKILLLFKFSLKFSPKISIDINTLRPKQLAAILGATLSNAFSWMKIYEFQLQFHWNLFLWVQITTFQHWFQIMAWHQPGNKPLSEPMMVRLTTPYMCHSASMN